MDVLIAEDDATALRVLENCVKRWGYEPRTAKNGQRRARSFWIRKARTWRSSIA